MATVKLGEKPIVETIGDSDHVIAEVGGNIRRVPAKQLKQNDVSDLDALLDAINGDKVWVPGLPPVTEADDGKVLGVKDGIWSAVLGGTSALDGLELWHDVILSENTNAVTLTQKDNGDPIKVQELFFIFMGDISENSTRFRLRYNDGVLYQLFKIYSRTTYGGENCPMLVPVHSKRIAPYFYFYEYLDNPLPLNSSSLDGSGKYQNQGVSANRTLEWDAAFNTSSEQIATNLSFSVDTGTMLAGSRILIYGRDIDA